MPIFLQCLLALRHCKVSSALHKQEFVRTGRGNFCQKEINQHYASSSDAFLCASNISLKRQRGAPSPNAHHEVSVQWDTVPGKLLARGRARSGARQSRDGPLGERRSCGVRDPDPGVPRCRKPARARGRTLAGKPRTFVSLISPPESVGRGPRA